MKVFLSIWYYLPEITERKKKSYARVDISKESRVR